MSSLDKVLSGNEHAMSCQDSFNFCNQTPDYKTMNKKLTTINEYIILSILMLMCFVLAVANFPMTCLLVSCLTACMGCLLFLLRAKHNKQEALAQAKIDKLNHEKRKILSELKEIKAEEKNSKEVLKLLERPLPLFGDQKTKCKDVLYLECRNDAVYCITKDGKYHPPSYKSLKNIGGTVCVPPVFIPIHRGHLVNMFNVQSIDRKNLTLKLVNGRELKIARPRKVAVLKAYEDCQKALIDLKRYLN